MAYINTQTNQYPVSEQDIRNEYPNTSFAIPFQAPEGYAVVFPSPVPTVDNPVIQFARETTPVLTDKGHYEQAWEISDIYSDYIDPEGVLHTKAEQEAEAIARNDEQLKQKNKQNAMSLLQATDWVENNSVRDDSKVIHLINYSEFDAYRDALRLIAVNPPVKVDTWPTKPEEVWAK